LGEKVAGVMGNHEAWVEDVRAASERVGELMWTLPLPDEYRKLLESEIADLRNIGTSGMGGALTAGLFLEAFVGDVPWVHLDIAGPARAASDDGELAKGGTGFAVRTLVEVARTFEVPTPKAKKPVKKKPVKKKPVKKKPVKKKPAKKQPAKKRASARGPAR
jgi:leucyl aminopeptidase